MSSHASRVWITSGRARRVGQGDLGGERHRAGPRGASGRSGSRARTRRRRPGRRVEQVGDRLDAVAGLVRVQPDRGVDLGVPGRHLPAPRCDDARSQPTVTIVVDAGRRGLGDELAGRRRRAGGSASRPNRSRGDPREQRRTLGHRRPTRVAAPRDVVGHPLVEHRAGQPDALPDRLRRRRGSPARPGRRRSAAPRGRRRARRRPARPGPASTARWPRGGRWSPAPAATWPPAPGSGRRRPTPRRRPRRRRRRPRRAGCPPPAPARRRRTSTPTTVATRAARLPRLLARSAL